MDPVRLSFISQTINCRLFQTEKFADHNFKFDENGKTFSKREKKKPWEKRRNARCEQFLLFPQCFQKRLVLKTRKNTGLFRKEFNL